jgi:hypothetical protein
MQAVARSRCDMRKWGQLGELHCRSPHGRLSLAPLHPKCPISLSYEKRSGMG